MDSTHPLTPSAREGESKETHPLAGGVWGGVFLDCFESAVADSRNDELLESFESANSKIVDEFLGLCETNE